MSESAPTRSAASFSSPCSAMLSAFTGGRSSLMVASPPEDCTLTNSPISVAGVVLERQAQPHPEVLELAVLDRHVLADHFGHPEVAHGAGRGRDRGARGVLPGFLADPDDLCYAVDTHRPSSSHVLGARDDGLADPDVGAAPADVANAVQVRLGDLAALGLDLLDQRHRGHDLAGLAESALGDVGVQPGLLHRVQ